MELGQTCGLFPLERIGSEMATAVEHSNQNLFAKIDRLMCGDRRRAQSGFDKAAAFINGVFCSLANLDVRFEFDPLSLDDCRCEMISVNEYNLLCTLKQVPYEDMSVEGDGATGAVRIRLSDVYQDSYEKAGWEDVCSVTSTGKRYLNTKKIISCLHRAIQSILTRERQESAPIVCRRYSSHLTLVINLHLAGVYKINLLPTLRISRKVLALKYFDEKITRIFNSLDETDTIESIQLVAKPVASFPDSLWRITFNDLEKRLLNLEKFSCANHCLFTVNFLQQEQLLANGLPCLSSYDLQMLVLREMVKMPHKQDWEEEKTSQRLDGILKSAKTSLNRKANISIFTNVNVFGGYKKSDVKLLCTEFGHMRKRYKQILFFNRGRPR